MDDISSSKTTTPAARKPRNPDAYREAVAAAEGDIVQELTAAAVVPDMTIRHDGEWLVVRFKKTHLDTVRIDFITDDDRTLWRFAGPATPMYRRIRAAGRQAPAPSEDGSGA